MSRFSRPVVICGVICHLIAASLSLLCVLISPWISKKDIYGDWNSVGFFKICEITTQKYAVCRAVSVHSLTPEWVFVFYCILAGVLFSATACIFASIGVRRMNISIFAKKSSVTACFLYSLGKFISCSP
eukprot:Sdes_comp9515_c0_seq1m986